MNYKFCSLWGYLGGGYKNQKTLSSLCFYLARCKNSQSCCCQISEITPDRPIRGKHHWEEMIKLKCLQCNLFDDKQTLASLSYYSRHRLVRMYTNTAIHQMKPAVQRCHPSITFYLTLEVVCTVGSWTVTMPSALVFPTTVGLVFRMSGAVVAVTRCCRPPALLARLVSRNEYRVSGSRPVMSFWVCFPSTSTDWPLPYKIWKQVRDSLLWRSKTKYGRTEILGF